MTQKQSPQKTAEDHFDGKLTEMMKRDVENAIGCWLFAKDLDPATGKNMDFRLRRLLKYLKQQHTRWNYLTKDDMNTTNSKFMKTLNGFLYNLKRKPDFLRDLKAANRDKKDLNDVSDVTTETEDEEENLADESQHAADEKMLFPEEVKGPDAAKTKAGKPKPPQSQAQEATHAGSVLGKRTSEMSLDFEEANDAAELFRCVKRVKFLQAEMKTVKHRMEEIVAGTCIRVDMA